MLPLKFIRQAVGRRAVEGAFLLRGGARTLALCRIRPHCRFELIGDFPRSSGEPAGAGSTASCTGAAIAAAALSELDPEKTQEPQHAFVMDE